MMTVSGFFAQIIETAKEADIKPIKPPENNDILCQMCRYFFAPKNENQTHCQDCQSAVERGYQIHSLAGQCRTGSDYTGTRWHARLVAIVDDIAFLSSSALCSYRPKGRSGGWSEYAPENREVTCPKCLKKLVNRPDGER